jgi:hypothetical protein
MTPDDVDLLDCERLVSDSAELIYRQIAPHMLIDDGKVASTAFGPNRSDNNMPSYSRSALVSAQEARDWNTRNAASPSLGVWAVAVGEVSSADSRVVDDNDCPLEEGEKRAPGHCYVDFRGLSRSKRKELRARLHMYAMSRGEIPTKET